MDSEFLNFDENCIQFCRLNPWIVNKHLISVCMYISSTYVLLSIFALYHMHFRHYSLHFILSIKIYFKCALKLILIKKFKGTFPCGSMEFHGLLSKSKVLWNSMERFPYSRVPWNSMELRIFPKKVPWNSTEWFWSSMEFHGIPWNCISLKFKKNHTS